MSKKTDIHCSRLNHQRKLLYLAVMDAFRDWVKTFELQHELETYRGFFETEDLYKKLAHQTWDTVSGIDIWGEHDSASQECLTYLIPAYLKDAFNPYLPNNHLNINIGEFLGSLAPPAKQGKKFPVMLCLDRFNIQQTRVLMESFFFLKSWPYELEDKVKERIDRMIATLGNGIEKKESKS